MAAIANQNSLLFCFEHGNTCRALFLFEPSRAAVAADGFTRAPRDAFRFRKRPQQVSAKNLANVSFAVTAFQ